MNPHAQRKQLSYQSLQNARNKAQKKDKYQYARVRDEIKNWVKERFGGRLPHDWQLDAAEAVLLGLDTIVVAPTGAGKTLPFIMLLAKCPKKKIIIISPLIALQQDMVRLLYI